MRHSQHGSWKRKHTVEDLSSTSLPLFAVKSQEPVHSQKVRPGYTVSVIIHAYSKDYAARYGIKNSLYLFQCGNRAAGRCGNIGIYLGLVIYEVGTADDADWDINSWKALALHERRIRRDSENDDSDPERYCRFAAAKKEKAEALERTEFFVI